MNTNINFNSWLSQVKKLAVKTKIYSHGTEGPLGNKQLNSIIKIQPFQNYFLNGKSPQEALNLEMEFWSDL